MPLDPAALSRDPAVGEAYLADALVYHGPLLRATLDGIRGAVDRIASGAGVSAICRRCGSTASSTRSHRWPRPEP